MKNFIFLLFIFVCNNAFASDNSRTGDISDCTKADMSYTQINSLKSRISSALHSPISDEEWKDSNVIVSRVNININKKTMVVYLSKTDHCGSGGCTVIILSYGDRDNEIKVVSHLITAKLPIVLLRSSSHGWRDIAVHIPARDEASSFAILKFDGQKYPSNPSMVSEKISHPNGDDLFGKDAPAGINCILH